MIYLRALFLVVGFGAIIVPAADAKDTPFRYQYSDCVVDRDVDAARLALAKFFARNESNAMENLHQRFVGCGDSAFSDPLKFSGQISESLMIRGYASEKSVDFAAGGWDHWPHIMFATCIEKEHRMQAIDVLRTRPGSLAEANAMKSLISSAPDCLVDEVGKSRKSKVASRDARGSSRAALALMIYATGGAGTDLAKEASNA